MFASRCTRGWRGMVPSLFLRKMTTVVCWLRWPRRRWRTLLNTSPVWLQWWVHELCICLLKQTHTSHHWTSQSCPSFVSAWTGTLKAADCYWDWEWVICPEHFSVCLYEYKGYYSSTSCRISYYISVTSLTTHHCHLLVCPLCTLR